MKWLFLITPGAPANLVPAVARAAAVSLRVKKVCSRTIQIMRFSLRALCALALRHNKQHQASLSAAVSNLSL